MQRKSALLTMAGLAAAWAAPLKSLAAAAGSSPSHTVNSVPNLGKPLKPPAHGPVRVGVVVGPNLVSIDAFGPMTAFGDAMLDPNSMMGPPLFDIYWIAETTKPLDVDGLKVQPQYSFANAPQPHVLVLPAQDDLPSTLAYVKKASANAEVTMSVCVGAFLAAKAGLFDGLRATTHHSAYDLLAQRYPKITVIRGPRYVEDVSVSSSGGESSGIDLALRVVERYYGGRVAVNSAYNMEYRRMTRPLNASEV